MWADLVNGSFELCGGAFIALSVRRLHREKLVRGVSPLASAFFTAWGYWNLYFYPSLGQWLSFAGGLGVVAMNTVWVCQMAYYSWREAHSPVTRGSDPS